MPLPLKTGVQKTVVGWGRVALSVPAGRGASPASTAIAHPGGILHQVIASKDGLWGASPCTASGLLVVVHIAEAVKQALQKASFGGEDAGGAAHLLPENELFTISRLHLLG